MCYLRMVTQLPLTQEMNYVRCLLVFKLWKRMLPCQEERNSINRLAVAKLSPPPAQVSLCHMFEELPPPRGA
jgi:hypothetical protein